MEERTGGSGGNPRYIVLYAGVGRDGFSDPDGFHQHHIDRRLSKSDGGAGHIIGDHSNHRSNRATNLPNWYHYGAIAIFTLGVIAFWVTQILRS